MSSNTVILVLGIVWAVVAVFALAVAHQYVTTKYAPRGLFGGALKKVPTSGEEDNGT